MPVYNIEVPPQTRNAWAEGLGSLADAFAPNPALEIERAKAGMAREELNFNMGMKEREFGLAARETDANVARLYAAADQARAAGDLYGEQQLTEAAERAKYEAETGLLTSQLEAGREFELGMDDPNANIASIMADAALGDDIEINPAQIATSRGMQMGPELDALFMGGGGAFGSTQTGYREGLRNNLDVERSKPVKVGENETAYLDTAHPSYDPATSGILRGQTSVADTERVIQPGAGGLDISGPNFTADAPTPPDFNVYTWADESGVQHQTMARVLADGRIVDREMNELPMTAIETPVSVNATSLSGASLGVKTEADKKVFSLLRRMINSDKYLQTDPVPGVMQFMMALPGDSMWSTLSRRLLSNDPAESFMASAQQFLTAVLRLDSGAAVPITEYPSYYAQFIPLPGDGAETIRRKAEARRVAMEALRDPLMGEASAEDLMIRVSEEVGEPPPLPAAIAAAAGLPRGRVVEDPAAAAGAPATAAPAQRKYEWTFNPGAS